MKRKIVNLSLALILILVCVISFAIDGATAKAGAGYGFDTSIKTIDELLTVFEFISQDSIAGESVMRALEGTNVITPLASISESQDKFFERREGYTHSSATVHISTRLSASTKSSDYELSNGIVEINQSLERELTAFLTEDATYYISEGIFYLYTKNQSKYSSNENITISKFNVHFYCCEEGTYARFNEFTQADSSFDMQIKNKNSGKWIELPLELASTLIDVDYENREVLSSMGQMLDFLIENGEIDKLDRSVSFDEKEIADIFDKSSNTPFDPTDKEVEFSIDLSNPTAPSLYSNSVLDSDSEGGKISRKIKLENNIVIKNIDNTVIKFKDSYVDIKTEKREEFEKLFIIEERSEDDD